MKPVSKYRAALLLVLAAALTLSGCYAGAIDQYFSLPQPDDEYLQLQRSIDQEIASGSEYAAPTGGSNRQSVQLCDLDGDGSDEALAFFRDAQQTLRVCVYAADGSGYRQALSISGEGTSIGSVEYADLNGDGVLELLVTWQGGASMRLLTVYDLSGWGGDVLLTADCAEFLVCDMTLDGRSDLLLLRSDGAAYTAELVAFIPNGEPAVSAAPLSADIAALKRVRAVTLTGDLPALLVESAFENGDLVTDLLVSRNGALSNITLNTGSGVSDTRRSYNTVYAADIDGDRYIEIPQPALLYNQTGSGAFWSITWYAYDASGVARPKLTTYHSYTDGWYLVLPEGWARGLTVRREDSVSGERAVVLSNVLPAGGVSDRLIIYTLTGENRAERSRTDGRFVILEEESTVYAAKILSGTTQSEVMASFKLIYSEWSAGTV